MAATLTHSNELTHLSFPIVKFEATEDGDLYVYGKATDGSVDSDEQIVDPDFSSKAIQDWLASGANVRVQHNSQRDPAGVGVEVNTGPEGDTWVKSLVVEPVAKRLVEKGALRAYSVGIARPKVVRDNVARGGRIVGGEIVEISLVDRPANKNCGIQLVKSADDGTLEYTDELFGTDEIMVELKGAITMTDEDMDQLITKLESTFSNTINKAVAPVETVAVELPSDVSVSFSPGDLAKLLEHRRVAEKRQMDPSVGGGVDRDKIPAADFAGRDRSFPIVTPGDVQDAASSIGRAGSSNYSSDKLKANIIRIARRKGDAFVAQLPDSWKKELGVGNKSEDDEALEKGKKGKKSKKPFPGAHEGFTDEHQPPHTAEDDEALADKAAAPAPDTDSDDADGDEKGDNAATKGAKNCPKCDMGYDADSKLRRCKGCNAKLPRANVMKGGDRVVCPGCGANIHDKHNYCPECGKKVPMDVKPANKNHDFSCLGCGKDLDDDEKYCPNCGKQNPGYEGMNEKASKPTPDGGAVGPGASAIQPVPEHREPDGAVVEQFESDAGLPTVPDRSVKSYEMRTAERLKSIGVDRALGALHDLTCAAFHPVDVAKCYPNDVLKSIDVDEWQQKALDAASGAPYEEAVKATQLWQHAITIKGTESDVLDEIRVDAHKSFTDANPGPGSYPTPTELTPARFNRPYLTAGHANRSPGATDNDADATIPASGGIDAARFGRGYLDVGRADDSPSNKGAVSVPTPTGSVQRVQYQTAQRNNAESAMRAMHDHVAQTFPDLCPMNGPGVVGAPPAGARPVPVAAGSTKSEIEVEAEVKATETTVKKAKKTAKVNKAKTTKSADALTEVTSLIDELRGQIVNLTKSLTDRDERIVTLQKSVDALATLPDPSVAPFRGLAQNPNDNVTKSAGLPGGARTVAEQAELAQQEAMAQLRHEWRTTPDSAAREAAWSQLARMSGLPIHQ